MSFGVMRTQEFTARKQWRLANKFDGILCCEWGGFCKPITKVYSNSLPTIKRKNWRRRCRWCARHHWKRLDIYYERWFLIQLFHMQNLFCTSRSLLFHWICIKFDKTIYLYCLSHERCHIVCVYNAMNIIIKINEWHFLKKSSKLKCTIIVTIRIFVGSKCSTEFKNNQTLIRQS